MTSLASQSLYFGGKSLFNRKLEGLECRSRRSVEETCPLPQMEIDPRFTGRPSRSLATTPTTTTSNYSAVCQNERNWLQNRVRYSISSFQHILKYAYLGVIRSSPSAQSKVTIQHYHLNGENIIQNQKYKCKNNIKLIYLTFIHCTCKFEKLKPSNAHEKHKQSFLSENYNRTFHNK